VNKADFVGCHNFSYIEKYDMVQELKPGGSFLLNCPYSADELNEKLPAKVKKYIAENNINFYIINATKIASELGLGGKINTILQAAFFKIVEVIPAVQAVEYMKEFATKTYGKKGEKIVAMNHLAIERGMSDLQKITVQ
jgi:pyruvate-ferredoxin/flavodoxin oxidoreductase